VEVGPELPALEVSFFSAGLFVVAVAVVFGRLLLGLRAPEVDVFSFGRDVRKAPRTSSSCTGGAAIPTTTVQRQTNAETITLNRIEISLLLTRYSKFFRRFVDVPARG